MVADEGFLESESSIESKHVDTVNKNSLAPFTFHLKKKKQDKTKQRSENPFSPPPPPPAHFCYLIRESKTLSPSFLA